MTMCVRSIATWNVNGLRARLARVTAWLERQRPDVVCLQETKVADEQFPREAMEACGYRVAYHGQKAFNGVAILSREPLEQVVVGLAPEDPQCRLLAATVGSVRVMCAYFPNGQALGTDKYEYKLRWMEQLRERLVREVAAHVEFVLCGDFNVAPEERDTHDPSYWEGNILCSPPERQALGKLRALGLSDALRCVHPTETIFTWWDYRALGFAKNRGLRIDHIYVSDAVRDRIAAVDVDRDERKGAQPSDHAPLIMRLTPKETALGATQEPTQSAAQRAAQGST